jgi:hypothetical protein
MSRHVDWLVWMICGLWWIHAGTQSATSSTLTLPMNVQSWVGVSVWDKAREVWYYVPNMPTIEVSSHSSVQSRLGVLGAWETSSCPHAQWPIQADAERAVAFFACIRIEGKG